MPLFADHEPTRHGGPAPASLATRPAVDGDVDGLAAIRAARDEMPVADAAAIFRRQMGAAVEGRGLVLLAEVDDALAGYGVAERLARPGLPEGWYLSGVVVAPEMRRRGIGARLTRDRLDLIAGRASAAYYFVSERNRASIDLHARFGFREVQRDLCISGVTFTGGVGLLFRVDLAPAREGTSPESRGGDV